MAWYEDFLTMLGVVACFHVAHVALEKRREKRRPQMAQCRSQWQAELSTDSQTLAQQMKQWHEKRAMELAEEKARAAWRALRMGLPDDVVDAMREPTLDELARVLEESEQACREVPDPKPWIQSRAPEFEHVVQRAADVLKREGIQRAVVEACSCWAVGEALRSVAFEKACEVLAEMGGR